MNMQLKELSVSSMLCTGLSILAKVCFTIPVDTASVQDYFSQMKKIKPN